MVRPYAGILLFFHTDDHSIARLPPAGSLRLSSDVVRRPLLAGNLPEQETNPRLAHRAPLSWCLVYTSLPSLIPSRSLGSLRWAGPAVPLQWGGPSERERPRGALARRAQLCCSPTALPVEDRLASKVKRAQGGGWQRWEGEGSSRGRQVQGSRGGKSPRGLGLLVGERLGLRHKVRFYSNASGSHWSWERLG